MQPQPAPDPSLYVAQPTVSPWIAMAGMAFCGAFCLWKLALVGKIIVPLVSVILIAALLALRQREIKRIARQKIATGLVLTWKQESDSEGGKTWTITYRFAVNGVSYDGKGSAQSKLPKEGEPVPISYEPDKPSDSMPLASYWFFKFVESH